MAIELPPDYYLTNFRQLVDFVAGHYWPLLNAEERQFYQDITALPETALCLYIRLLSRKGILFRSSKLSYPEIGDVEEPARHLAGSGLLVINPKLTLAELLPLFIKVELTQALGDSAPKNARRDVLETMLLHRQREKPEEDGDCLLYRQLADNESLYQLLGETHFATFKLCFFGNLSQDLTEFVLRDLGIYRYENYPLDSDSAAFTERTQIDAHLQYYACLERLDESLMGDSGAILKLHSELPGYVTGEGVAGDASLKRRLQRVTNHLARQLERLGALDAAAELYRHNERPPARERLARIRVKQECPDAALAICEAMRELPVNEEERVFAEEFGYRTASKAGVAWPRPEKYQPVARVVEAEPREEGVEETVARLLSRQGDCFYVENTLFNGMLGLLLWDIVFTPLRGAFFNPFQTGPSDFYEAEFVAARQPLLEKRLQMLADVEAFGAIVRRHYEIKMGLANPLVNWECLSMALISLGLQRIPPAHWRVIFRRLLEDLRYHRNGLPDLIHFPDEGGYELVEVKAPGDRLQKNQLRWMRFFNQQAIPHSVVHVRWIE